MLATDCSAVACLNVKIIRSVEQRIAIAYPVVVTAALNRHRLYGKFSGPPAVVPQDIMTWIERHPGYDFYSGNLPGASANVPASIA
mgnify:CR=1 FL=1